MSRIRGLATVSLNEPHPAGFDALRHDKEQLNSIPQSGFPVDSAVLEMLMSSERIVVRLRAALKVCGFTTEEIDSIASDTNDGVRVVMEGHIIP